MGIFGKLRGYGDTIVVAASDSSNRSKRKADFICPSTDALGYITSNVLTSLPSRGGTIKLLEGTYTMSTSSTPILFDRDYVNLTGSGLSTLIKCGGAGITGTMVDLNSKDFINISNIKFEGNNSAANNTAIDINTVGSNVDNCYFLTCLYGLRSLGTTLTCNINTNYFYNCNNAVNLGSSVSYVGISCNTFNSCSGGYNIAIGGKYFTVIGNRMYYNGRMSVTGDYNNIVSNVIQNENTASAKGIYITGTSNNINSNNIIQTAATCFGIYFDTGSSNNVAIDNKLYGISTGYHISDKTMQNRYSIMERSRMINIVDADLDRYWHDADLTQATPYTTAIIAQPDYGRNVTMWITDADVGITAFRATVTGTTYTGKSITEQFHLSSFSGGSDKKATGHYPFMTISNITVQNCVGEGAGDVLNVGCGLNIGFLGSIAQSGDFVRYKVNEAITATPTPDYTYMTFPVTVGGPTDTYEVFYKRNRNYW